MNNNNLGHNNTAYVAQGSKPVNKEPLTQMLTPQYSYKINQAPNTEPASSKQTLQKVNMQRFEPSFKEKNKAMYNSSMNFGGTNEDGLLSLSSFGRKVNQPSIEKDQFLSSNQNDSYSNSAGKNFGLPTRDLKMASSAIFGLDNAQQNQMNKFPTFNLGLNQNNQNPPPSNSSTNQQKLSSKSFETAKQKRQRQMQEMFEIKKQLDDLTKKIKTVEQKNKANETHANKQTQKPASISYPTSYQSYYNSISGSSSTSSSSNSSNFSNKFNQYKNLPNNSNIVDQSYKNQPVSSSYNDYTQQKKTQQIYSNPPSISINQERSAIAEKPLYTEIKYDQYDNKYDNLSKNKTTSYDNYTSFKVDSSPSNSYLSPTPAQYSYSTNTSIGSDSNNQGVFKKKKNVGYFQETEKKQNFTKKPIQKPFEKLLDQSFDKSFEKSNDKPIQKSTQELKRPGYHPQTSTRSFSSNNFHIKKIQSVDYNDYSIPLPQLRQIKYSDFIIGKKMGKGMFGQVQLVKHKITGWVCGLKIMGKKVIRQQNYIGQIARELSIQFYLQHRNILQLYGYFQDQKNFYLLIEFCSGGQLLERLKQQRRMNERDVALIIKQVCQGVDYIHKQLIIHRDIKPENILFNLGVVKICDFGWAVYRGFGMRKTASGSPLYYPPEIVKGEQYDDKIDIWCIGMMAYECIMGKIPFKVYTEMDLKRIVSDQITFPEWVDVTDEAKDFILKTLKKNPQERMEVKQMLRHPFLTKHQEAGLSRDILDDFKRVLG